MENDHIVPEYMFDIEYNGKDNLTTFQEQQKDKAEAVFYVVMGLVMRYDVDVEQASEMISNFALFNLIKTEEDLDMFYHYGVNSTVDAIWDHHHGIKDEYV